MAYKKPSYPSVLLLSGSGRDRGKTQFACNVIRRWAKEEYVVAIKISAHVHGTSEGCSLIMKRGGFSLWEQLTSSAKDSGRFLDAGARRVFYLEAVDMELSEAFRHILEICLPESVFVIESGGLGRFIRAGIMLFIKSSDEITEGAKKELQEMSDRILFTGSQKISSPEKVLTVRNHCWNLI